MKSAAQLEIANAARDTAIQRAEDGAENDEKALALDAVRQCARELEYFTTEEAKEICPVEFNEPRAWGAVMKRAHAQGICEPTAQFKTSGERRCHRRPMRIWRRTFKLETE